MTKNMCFRFIGRIFLLAHTHQPPSDDEWDTALAEIGLFLASPGQQCVLVFTDGGAPSAAQRKRLRDVLNGRDLLIAVLSGALIPRFVSASIALFNKSIRSFTPDEFLQARDYLRIDEAEMKQLREAFAQLQELLLPRRVTALERATKT
jgi:hypothetical protein